MRLPGRLPLWNVLLALWCIRTLRRLALLEPIYVFGLGLSVMGCAAVVGRVDSPFHGAYAGGQIRQLSRVASYYAAVPSQKELLEKSVLPDKEGGALMAAGRRNLLIKGRDAPVGNPVWYR